MSEKLTVCLIGPHKGGKSSLLATLTDCVTQGVHGYPPEMRPSLQSITFEEFKDASGASGPIHILGAESGQYETLRREFAEGVGATDTLDTYDYFFRLAINGNLGGIDPARLPIAIQIVDAAGEIAIPQGGTPVTQGVREKFSSQILTCDAIVFIIPLVNLENTDWIQLMSELINKIARASTKRIRHVIVAFTQYERMFIRLGPSAFTYACDPRIALHIIRESLAATPWLDGLRALENDSDGGIEVRFTVTSAYGFVRRYHNPNIDPHADGEEKRFRRHGIATARALNEFWRPFLTAEPILYAALGLDSEFTFSYNAIDGQRGTTRRPRPLVKPPDTGRAEGDQGVKKPGPEEIAP